MVIVCPPPSQVICNPEEESQSYTTICEGQGSTVICNDTSLDGSEIVYKDSAYPFKTKWISFEPTVELKFSNLHAANQVVDGKLVCTVDRSKDGWKDGEFPSIVPINRDLAKDNMGIHYNDFLYCYDYVNRLEKVVSRNSNDWSRWETDLNDSQKHYNIEPLHLYDNSRIQSPIDSRDFVRCRRSEITRNNKQVQTFTSIVKKYRPIILPKVSNIFNDCDYKTRYKAYKDNSYGVFGWCTIPSKTMVNMEYNEDAIIVPSSYDNHNRVGGRNFLQLDPDFKEIYKHYDKSTKQMVYNIEDTWYFLYEKRDWTYFLLPFFNVKQNNEVYSNLLDQLVDKPELTPKNSNHLNGVIFEKSVMDRQDDATFGQVQRTCQFLASHQHNMHYLDVLSSKYTKNISFERLKELTGGK